MATIPSGIILIWAGTNGSIPSGWTRETAFDGKFVKGWGAEAPNTTGGAATHTHGSPAHSHDISHTHTFTSGNATSTTSGHHESSGSQTLLTKNTATGHTHTGTTGAASVTTSSSDSVTYSAFSNHPPYHEVIFIKAGASSVLATGIIALWNSASAPTNWEICDGDASTPDLRNKYLRGAATLGDSGATGGSTTNTHTISHTHTVPAHDHSSAVTSAPVAVGGVLGQDYNSNVAWCAAWGHTHTATFGSSGAFASDSNSSIGSQAETVEPAYKKIVAIQMQSSGIKTAGIIGLWLGAADSIPDGWLLCDGTNGTPDLQDYYMKIINTTGEIGNTGGSNTHTHAAQSHTHTSSAHYHSVTLTSHASETQAQEGGGASASSWRSSTDNHPVGTTDGASVSLASANTTANSSSNEPEYRTAVFVQFNKEIPRGAAMLGALLN